MNRAIFGLIAFILLQSLARAAGGGPTPLTLYETPAEAHWAPYYPDMPACDDTGVLSTISGRFAQTQREYWNPDLAINTFDRVREIAKGRVWTGADAKPRGLVDQLGGFWTAVGEVKQVAGIAPDQNIVFERFPKVKSFSEAVEDAFGGTTASMRAIQGLATLAESRPVRAVLATVNEAPRGDVEMRAVNLPAQ